jgi:PAS domain S-box-containing protein
MKLTDQKKLLLGLIIGFLSFYLSNAAVHSFVFNDHSLVEELTFSTGNPGDIFVHTLVLLEFAIFGIFLYKLFIKRNLAEEKLRESEQRWVTTLTSIGDAVIAVNIGEQVTFLNTEAEKLTGWTLIEASNKPLKNVLKIINEYTRKELDNPIAKVLETGQVTGLANNTILVSKNGTEIPIDDSAAPIKNKYGKISGVVLVFRDISERRLAEKKLGEMKVFNESIVESISETLLVIDPKDYRIIAANSAASEDLNLRKEDIVGKTCYEVTHNRQTPCEAPHNCPLKDVMATGKVAAANHVHFDKDQNRIDVEISAYPSLEKDGEITKIVHVARNVTERKKAEEKIKFQAYLLNHVGQAIIMVDNNRTIRFWNKAAEKLYGWSEEEALGRKVTELLGGTSPDEADEVARRLLSGESWSTEILATNRDGSASPVILNRTPIFKEDGEFIGAASITTDISLQKNAEKDLTFSLTSLSNSLDRIQELNEKLRVVGGLTRHDVRNKLSTVTGYAYILKKKHSDQADIIEGLSKMEQAVRESVKILDFAKMYEQIGIEELTYVDVETKLNEAVALFSESIPTIINDCRGLTVLADSFLRQLFFNFIDNTRKYGQKTTTVKVYYQNVDENSLKLIFEDDGVGIPLENKTSLFKEGFSTGGSTGFGLFLIKKMIDVYGWSIVEEGEPGKGAKFNVNIPKLNMNGKENYQISP